MTEQGNDNKYINCSRCKMKYHNTDDSIKQHFGYNRLDERYKVCVKCRQYKLDNRAYILEKGRERGKEYYYENHEALLAKNKQYRQDHTEQLNEKASKLVACDKCGEYVRYNGLAKHKTTNKCMNFTNKDYKTDDPVYCDLCGTITDDKNLLKHQTTAKCKKRAELNKQCC